MDLMCYSIIFLKLIENNRKLGIDREQILPYNNKRSHKFTFILRDDVIGANIRQRGKRFGQVEPRVS